MERYRRLFSIAEIETQTILQWAFGASLFYFFVSFNKWSAGTATTIQTAASGRAVCWPYFQGCAKLYFLQNLPFGYSQTTFYMLLYGAMMLIAYFMWKKQWTYAHMLMAGLWLWKMFALFVLSYLLGGPYDYYHVILTAILLFIPYKEYFLKIGFVFLYFMSVTVKFSSAWVLGTYFSSLQTGTPYVPDILTPIATNIVIFGQVVECWFLLSKRAVLQRISFAYAIFFHLYSGILVGYDYPSVALPTLAILFGPMYRHTPTPFTKKAVWGWLIIGLVALFQLAGFLISSDRYLTLEGNRYGMFMLEANHQCIVDVKTYSTGTVASSSVSQLSCSGFYCLTQTNTYMQSGEAVREEQYQSADAWNRCDPYQWWSRLHTQCTLHPSIARIALTFDHSINGGPFYRIVDVPNICDTSYDALGNNPWIKLPPEAPVIGYPVENVYF